MPENDISPGMVNVLVEEEARDWLKNFITEINEQDNRMTATPYYYGLVYDDEESGRRNIPVEYRDSVFFTEKAAKEYIVADAHNLPSNVTTFLYWGGRNPELKKLLESIGKVVGVDYSRK